MSTASAPPRLRPLFAVPNGLYAAGFGWLLGRRFVQLVHYGRKSGREFHTVVEVVKYDQDTGELVVVAAFGRSSDWLLNLQAAGRAEVDLGHGRRPASFRELSADEAAEVLAGYERRNALIRPILRRVLSALAGFDYDGSDDARRRLVDQLPLIAFRPARSATQP
jgi:deazaflavin-dependent oxidoreductase (nitroreductase family)